MLGQDQVFYSFGGWEEVQSKPLTPSQCLGCFEARDLGLIPSGATCTETHALLEGPGQCHKLLTCLVSVSLYVFPHLLKPSHGSPAAWNLEHPSPPFGRKPHNAFPGGLAEGHDIKPNCQEPLRTQAV